ncbi:ATP-dependent zinc metalloprotease FtsH [Gossypium australe]|uniref:ATP-dependent zinc metalloprotease FtsH n=1 Tax=Gossypium australe TaxID=47621 RepID=A0A5B6VLD3_9ROSI|nr:ATP-dependent zinc metalloprotease FtsH [Gossypium australe]
MKRGLSDPPPSSNFKISKDRRFSTSMRDLHDGGSQQATSMASTSEYKVMRNSICECCGRNHREECWRHTGACFGCGSLDHQLRYCPSKVEVITKTNLLLTNPLGQSTIANRLIKNCLLISSKHTFLANLLLLNFHEFDAILRLD